MSVSPKQREALKFVAEGRFVPTLVKEDDGWHARWQPVPTYGIVMDEVLAGWVDECVRKSVMTRLTEDAEDQIHTTLHDAFLAALKSRTGLVRWEDDACRAFAQVLSDWHTRVEEDPVARAALNLRLETQNETLSVVCDVPHGRRALKALGQASLDFPPLRGLRQTQKGCLEAPLSRREAEDFLRREKRDLSAPIVATAELLANDRKKDVQAKLVVKVAGEVVTAAEIKFLLEQGSSLVFFRERWIEVDRNKLRAALRALEKAGDKTLTEVEAMSFALGLGAFGALELEEVRAHGWLRGLVHELKMASRLVLPSADVPHLMGTLRTYQRRGVAWMKFLTDHRLGALLADDMGLGKTVQTISWILLTREDERTQPFLVVAPLTLLSNWRHEFQKFAPSLRIYTHHGEGRQLKKGFQRAVKDCDVVLTSYSLLTRDYAILRETNWAALILDEAQAIKNPNTQVARAVRALGARRRIALTGTPIENAVSDLWSLEEFLNPTFLGDWKSFVERFEKPIRQDANSRAGQKLKHALEPFILRRLKTDDEIKGELGTKREVKEYCALTAAQRTAYEAAIEDFRVSEKKQGDIFALINQLKLICDGAGKLDRLVELLGDIFAAGESALIFTQYAKVGETIQALLKKKFGKAYPFLHGGQDARAREREIQAFTANQQPMAFILSLRAGGFGLNLTKATHVIHFDRWWNPAVENQATDRAHRIGQTKDVFVHTFITEGTLEERVDELLEQKESLAGSLVSVGEGFLQELIHLTAER